MNEMTISKIKLFRTAIIVFILGLIFTAVFSLILAFQVDRVDNSAKFSIPYVSQKLFSLKNMPSKTILNISPTVKPENGSIVCKNGVYGLLNDDYCDCPDGSDEPTTSACSNILAGLKIFSCPPFFIPLSRVNDGVCDCPKGADEWMRELKYDCPT
jgi:hypothetical protein